MLKKNFNRVNKIAIVFTLLFCLTMLACRPQSDTLTPTERELVDSFYQKKVVELRPLLDSICAAQKDSLVERAADSLLKVRMEEIQKILNR
jgi:hypothetical protein